MTTQTRPAPRWHGPGGRWWARGAVLVLVGVVVLVVLTLVLIPQLQPAITPPPSTTQALAWPPATAEEEGWDSAKLAEGLQAIYTNDIRIHSLLIIRHGAVILDAYFYPYDGMIPHDQASVTKSIMTTLIGIAADQGKLQLDQPMLSFFPGRTIANRDARKERITVRQLVSMSSGLDCTRGTTEALQREATFSPDAVQFALDRRVTAEPGSQFEYCGLGMHLLSGILRQATGMSALEYARQNLFGPLGISQAIWPADAQGNNRGWGDLHLLPRDSAKIGYLWLNKGVWQGKQIVSREWVESSVKVQIRADGEDDYGYGWWVGRPGGGEPGEYNADGSGGQRVLVLPSLDMVWVTTGGGFVFDEILPYIVPALVDRDEALPANPAGMDKLNAALAAITHDPATPRAVAPLPTTARAISGRTFVFDPNPYGLASMRLDFDEAHPAEARLAISFPAEQIALTGTVGLDGVYRAAIGREDVPGAYRGRWTDPQTFLVDFDQIANIEAWFITLQFAGDPVDRVVFDGRDRASGMAIRATGRLQRP